ncbi:hypothetical protein J6590_065569 [Homalodisca vitripennis]|nr:hypothetical protein J6590_065569 [Homalodisca vitripennis]
MENNSKGKKKIALPKGTFVGLVKETLNRGSENVDHIVKNGFEKAGIYPLNCQRVVDCLPKYARRTEEEETVQRDRKPEEDSEDLGFANSPQQNQCNSLCVLGDASRVIPESQNNSLSPNVNDEQLEPTDLLTDINRFIGLTRV